jgi:hypothetical protein
VAARAGWSSQWRKTKGNTTRIAGARFLVWSVMASSGCVGAQSGSIWLTVAGIAERTRR